MVSSVGVCHEWDLMHPMSERVDHSIWKERDKTTELVKANSCGRSPFPKIVAHKAFAADTEASERDTYTFTETLG